MDPVLKSAINWTEDGIAACKDNNMGLAHVCLEHVLSRLQIVAGEADADLSAGWAGQRADAQRREAIEVRRLARFKCRHGQLSGQPCSFCDADAAGDYEFEMRGNR